MCNGKRDRWMRRLGLYRYSTYIHNRYEIPIIGIITRNVDDSDDGWNCKYCHPGYPSRRRLYTPPPNKPLNLYIILSFNTG